MRDREHRRALELLSNQLLDGLLCHHVDIGRRFVKHNQLIAPEDGPQNTNELALANRQVLALLLDLEFETFAIVFVVLLLIASSSLARVRLLGLALGRGGILSRDSLVFDLGRVSFPGSSCLILELLLRTALHEVLEASLLDQLHQPFIAVLVKGIKVESEATREEGGILRNHCDLVTQGFQVELVDVLSVNFDRARLDLNNPR
mmetsp:Transcript_4367/g.5426  ORF Transcript_4367/g.5426 Transcript_4367/m.5426 type:complete len:204 (-) Transcript_4367:2931-3542(-)